MVGRVAVTSADIARLAGVKPTAVSNWRRRHADFPAPVGGTDRSPRFDLAEVEIWLNRQGRSRSISADERLWQAFDSVRDAVPPEDALIAIGLLLLSRRPGAMPPEDPDGLLSNPRLTALLAAAEHADFESLCARYFDTATRPGFTATAPRLADLMVRIAGTGHHPGSLLDPACGSGTILLSAHAHGHRPLTGYDVNPSLTRLAGLRLALRGAVEGRVRTADALRSSAGTYLHVVSAPPLVERGWDDDGIAQRRHWEYGVPPRQEPELAWVQHALTRVDDGGTAVLLMPPAAAVRPSGRRIRRELLVRGALQAVISLPAGLATHYTVALQIWVLHRPHNGSRPPRLLLVDAAGNEPTNTESWDRVDSIAAGCWADYRRGPEDFQERPGVARSVPLEEFLDDDVDVTPRRHLPMPVPTAVSSDELAKALSRFTQLAASLRIELPEIPPAVPARTVALQDLSATGAAFIRRTRAVDLRSPTVRGRLLTGADLAIGGVASQEADVDADELRNPPIRAGDVLAPVLARRLTARVATADDIGCFPSPTVYVVRTDPAVLDPWFLAGYLSSTDGGRQAERLGGSARIDLRRVRIPFLPIMAQQEYGKQYRQLEEFLQTLRAVHNCGLDLARNATDAITAGLTGRTH